MTEEDPALLAADRQFATGRALPAGRGVEWLRRGWELFVRNPALWVAFAVVLLLIFGVLAALGPLGQIAGHLLAPLFAAGLMHACRVLERGGELAFEQLFNGFRHHTQALVLLGLCYLAGALAIMVVSLVIVAGGSAFGILVGDLAGAGIAAGSLGLALLVFAALSVPLLMAMWFAPALVVFCAASVWSALSGSFAACLRNVLPMAIYGLLLLVAFAAAMIPFGLGLLVVVPVAAASLYASYVDIFE
jgi:uncharacterized membrane protein